MISCTAEDSNYLLKKGAWELGEFREAILFSSETVLTVDQGRTT